MDKRTKMSKNSHLVYSTETGRIKSDQSSGKTAPGGDGILRIRREIKGRKGKGVTTISGLMLDDAELKSLASRLKQLCGSGGAIKDHIIEIQGDHRQKVQQELEKQGFQTKLAGG